MKTPDMTSKKDDRHIEESGSERMVHMRNQGITLRLAVLRFSTSSSITALAKRRKTSCDQKCMQIHAETALQVHAPFCLSLIRVHKAAEHLRVNHGSHSIPGIPSYNTFGRLDIIVRQFSGNVKTVFRS